MASSPPAIPAFRALLRAQRYIFKNDAFAQNAALKETRQHFESNRSLTDPSEVQKLVAAAYETADFIRTSIVQARLNESGNYEMKVSKEHSGNLVELPNPDQA